MARRYYSSTFTETELAASVGASDTLLSLDQVSGAPSTVPWTGAIDRNTALEELVTVTTVSGTSLTVVRGVDGTTAKAHSVGATFEHTSSARDYDEPNAHINTSTAAHAATAISFAPTGTIAATDVQTAIAEVAAEKVAGTVRLTVASTAPTSPATNDLWVDTA